METQFPLILIRPNNLGEIIHLVTDLDFMRVVEVIWFQDFPVAVLFMTVEKLKALVKMAFGLKTHPKETEQKSLMPTASGLENGFEIIGEHMDD